MIYFADIMTGKRAFIFILVAILIGITTYFLVQFSKGYRPDFSQRSLKATGLLVATSHPDGAQIFVDGKLKSATNATISLSPDTYEVEIKKERFHPWKKTLKIEKELVSKTDAWLFPLVPDFSALTFTGAQKPLLSPDETKLVYQVDGETLEKNGLWVIDLSGLPFGISREPKIIIKSAPRGRNFSLSTYQWSPDSKQILVTLPKVTKLATKEAPNENFLLDPSDLTPATNLIDITDNLTTIQKQWQKESQLRQEQKLKKLPKSLLPILKDTTDNLVFSPDENKILYIATASASIPDKLIPPIPGSSSQKQERDIQVNKAYVYDLKEDRNFAVAANDNCQIGKADTETGCLIGWFPNSKHLIVVKKDQIQALEYEGTNQTTIYAGNFQFPFAFPFPSGDKMVILTTISSAPGAPANLYSVSLH